MQEPDLVVTLIHGTWGRGFAPFRWYRPAASWTQTSELRERVESIGARINFVNWSGANSFRARREAAARIQEAVQNSDSLARHVLVAHSHGGTAAMLALRLPEIARRVDGLVCLATPVPVVRVRRVFDEVTNRTRIAVSRPVITLAIVIAYLVAVPSVDAQLLASMVFAVAIVWLLAAPALAIVPPIRFAATWAARALSRRAMKFVEANAVTADLGVPVLMVRAPGDEASGVMTAAHFTRSVMPRLRWVSSIIVGILMLGLVIFSEPNAAADMTAQGTLLVIALIGATWGFWMALFGAPLALLLAWTFGWDYVWNSFFVEATAESGAPGSAQIFQSSGRASRRGMSHAVYNDVEAAEAVAKWIQQVTIRHAVPSPVREGV